MVHCIIYENGRFVSLSADGDEPSLLGNCDGGETAVAFLSYEVVLLFRLRVVLHDMVSRRVGDFILVDEVDVVGD